MSNLSANSVEQAQETCLYLENPNIDNALNNTLEDMKTEMTENEGVQNPLKIYIGAKRAWKVGVQNGNSRLI